ncbi:MOSC domain-containing protein, partial [Nocardia gipuzkoensis]
MARLLSLNVGMPADIAWHGRTVHTGIFKYPVDGPRLVRKLNVDGDGQGDLGGHGGEIRAVLVYQHQSYEYWREWLGRDDLGYGQFGENFTVDGLSDEDVHIGDRYRIGDAEFEVTQPRVTCFRVGMRLNEPRMPALLVAHHRPGFYFRVLTEGMVRVGDEIVRTRVGRHRMSVAAIDALLYLPDRDTDQLRKALDIPALSPGWQGSFRELLNAAERRTPTAAPPVGVEPGSATSPSKGDTEQDARTSVDVADRTPTASTTLDIEDLISGTSTSPAAGPGWSGFRPLRVTRITEESASVISIHLADPDGARLARPEPGQYLTVRVPGAADPAPIRNYSLSGCPSDSEYRISVKRETRGAVSTYLHTRLRVGDILDIASPRGDFVLDVPLSDGPPVLLISAGVGATPVLAMLHALAASKPTCEIWWLHTARSAAEHAFATESHHLLTGIDRHHEYIFYTTPTPPTPAKRLTAETLAALRPPVDATVYLCGPMAFMDAIRHGLVALGLDPTRIHTELFGSLPPINPGITDTREISPHQPPDPTGTGP